MLRNHFIPHNPELLINRQEVDHNVNTIKVTSAKQKANRWGLSYTVQCHHTLPDESMVRFHDHTTAFELQVIDHDHKEELKVIFPVTFDETFNFNNGTLAEALLSDTVDLLVVSVKTEYEDSTAGHMFQVHKRFLEVNLIDMATKEIIHTFWIGDYVQSPKSGNHSL